MCKVVMHTVATYNVVLLVAYKVAKELHEPLTAWVGTNAPVPKEATQAIGAPGKSRFASSRAMAHGLFASKAPS